LALARAAALFVDRMRAADAGLEEVFRTATGLGLDDYLSIIAHITSSAWFLTQENPSSLSREALFNADAHEAAPGELGRVSREYLSREAQTADDLRVALWDEREDADEVHATTSMLTVLRDHPILRAADGRAMILDPRSFIERASAGPLFHLTRNVPKRATHWFTLFGKSFEDYCTEQLGRAYPTSPLLTQRYFPNPQASRQNGKDFEICDAVLLNARSAAFFEMKAVFIPDTDVAPNEEPEKYIKRIRERYSSSKRAGGAADKGLGQLARSIRELAAGTLKSVGIELKGIKRILPVLVVHDTHLDAPVHSKIFAQEFASHLRPGGADDDWSEIEVGAFRVAHLILLSIDDFERLEPSSENFSLIECFEAYAAKSPDRMFPFHNFLALSEYRKKLRENRELAGRAEKVLDTTAKRLFGVESIADAVTTPKPSKASPPPASSSSRSRRSSSHSHPAHPHQRPRPKRRAPRRGT
jgi:hypothetical protein